jgi:hypothetical protein
MYSVFTCKGTDQAFINITAHTNAKGLGISDVDSLTCLKLNPYSRIQVVRCFDIAREGVSDVSALIGCRCQVRRNRSRSRKLASSKQSHHNGLEVVATVVCSFCHDAMNFISSTLPTYHIHRR